MGKNRNRSPQAPPTHWETERTLADAEQDDGHAPAADPLEGAGASPSETACTCGHREFLLQGFFAVVDGRVEKEPVELEGLTCPECGREYEAVAAEDGRILRGDFVGYADLDD